MPCQLILEPWRLILEIHLLKFARGPWRPILELFRITLESWRFTVSLTVKPLKDNV